MRHIWATPLVKRCRASSATTSVPTIIWRRFTPMVDRTSSTSTPRWRGIQITLTGTVNGPPVTAITDAVVTLASENDSQATFNWSFHYDKDPITAGVQDGTATGTLAFDKVLDTFTLTDTTPVEGFSFSVLHTNELLAKAPPGN